MKRFFLIIFMIMFIIGTNLSAIDYYVDVNKGTDSNNGDSWNDAFQTVSKACQFVRVGDTVLIAPGIYREILAPIFSGESDERRIIFKGAGAGVVFDGSNIRNCASNPQNYITFDNIEFTNTAYSSVGAVHNTGSYFKLINCKVYNNTTCYSHGYAAGFTNKGNYAEVINCMFYNNHYNANHYGVAGAISTVQYLMKNIESCLFYNNSIVTTSYANVAPAVFGYVERFKNNILVKNHFTTDFSSDVNKFSAVKGYYNDSREFVEWDFNCIYGNYNGGSVTPKKGKHDIYVDPQFLDEENELFYLKKTSPVIGMGMPVDGYFTIIGPLGVGRTVDFSNDWDNWTDKDGVLISSNNSAYIKVDSGVLKLNNCIEAEIKSPVYYFGEMSNLKSLVYKGDVWENLKTGLKQVVDVDRVSPREYMWRGSNEEFLSNNTAIAWNKQIFGFGTDKNYKYYQMRVVFRKDGE